MKVRHYMMLATMFMLAATTGVMSSCSDNDDNPVSNPTEVNDDDDDPEEPGNWDGVVPVDGLASFMARFIERDSVGNFMGYVYGKPLDEADPSVLSIGVESLEEADEIFRNIMNDTVNYVSMGLGNITYTPVDTLGNKQGEIYLTAGGDGCIARITFSDNIVSDELSEVRFIDSKLWPENDESQFEVGKLYSPYYQYRKSSDGYGPYVEQYFWCLSTDENEGERQFLCLEADKDGKPALLIWINKEKYSYSSKAHTYVNYPTMKYGLWTTMPKEQGRKVRQPGYDGWKGNPYKGEPDMDYAYSSSIKGLERASKVLHKNWDFFVSIYGSDRLNNDIIWSNEHFKWDIITFKLYGYQFKANKKGHWRSYTNLGHWNCIVESNNEVAPAGKYKDYSVANYWYYYVRDRKYNGTPVK